MKKSNEHCRTAIVREVGCAQKTQSRRNCDINLMGVYPFAEKGLKRQ
jgi:hypothetical protein